MRISELAKKTGISTETIRYYEKQGLMPLPQREFNGYRQYGAAHLQQLGFIRHCRSLDMSIDEIQQLMSSVHTTKSCAFVNEMVQDHLHKVREQIKNLKILEKQLISLSKQCEQATNISECGIVHELIAASEGSACVCHQEAVHEHKNAHGFKCEA